MNLCGPTTLIFNVLLFKFADADMGISMWSTMTTPIGKCMPLEAVQHQPSTAKATDLLHLILDSAKR